MQTLLQDLRYGIRLLLKRPGFTAMAVITLALGIGANTTIFSFVDMLYYRPLPVREPYQLVNVEGTRNGEMDLGFAYPAYAYFRDHSTAFEALAAHYSTAPLNIVTEGDSREANGAVVSANYFSMLGIRPDAGRFFLPEEDSVPDRDAVAVISYGMWQSRFGADPSIIEKEIRVNGVAFKIVGVAPKDFPGAEPGYPNEIWIPTMMLRVGYRWCDALNKFDCKPLTILGRLAAGRNLSEAEAEMKSLASQLATAHPEMKDRSVSLQAAIGVRPQDRKQFSFQMQLLMAVASLLLLIACANVAGLLLVRGTTRRKEIAIRLSLGASRSRLVRQLLTESLFLALAGGALGLILSLWAKDLLMSFYSMSTGNISRSFDLSLNLRVLAYSLTLSTITGLLSGLVPALQATRQDLARTLKDESGQSPRHNRLRNVLVAGQVALSLSLVVGAGLLVRSAAHVQKGENFDPAHVALLRLRPRLVHYSPEKAQAFTREVVRRLEALASVQSVSLAKGSGLAWLSTDDLRVRLPEQAADPEHEPRAEYHEIAPRFFETLKIPLTEGRDFNDGDRPGAPRVVIINETLARQTWPENSPLEQFLILNDKEFQVVGVFKDAQLRNSTEGPLPFLYVPYWQNAFEQQTDSRMVVRVDGDPQTMLPLLEREIAAVDPNVPISEDLPMTEQVKGHYMPVLLASSVMVSAGAIALFLSMTGLYSALAFAVAERTREIGIRMALGARPRDVLKLIVRQGMLVALIGVGIGLTAAFALTRLMSSLLFGVSATDATTFIVVSLVLIGVALGACFVPARRATRVDPMVALRYE